MEQLISTFHLDWKLLIAQAINFAIVVAVLYKFAYKPLLKHMNERTSVIEKGLKDAQKAQEELEKAEARRQEELDKAKKEAHKIIQEAQEKAVKQQEDIVNEAKEKSAAVVQKAKEQLRQEKEKMVKDAKKEIGELVTLAAEKVAGKEIQDKEMVKDVVDKI